MIEITLILPEADALALVLDEVPLAVKIAILSGFKAMGETPAEGLDSMKRRRRRATQTEAA